MTHFLSNQPSCSLLSNEKIVIKPFKMNVIKTKACVAKYRSIIGNASYHFPYTLHKLQKKHSIEDYILYSKAYPLATMSFTQLHLFFVCEHMVLLNGMY